MCQVVFFLQRLLWFLVDLTVLFHPYRLWSDKQQNVFERMSKQAALASFKFLLWNLEKNHITVSAFKLQKLGPPAEGKC
jgi:hypothetical protein